MLVLMLSVNLYLIILNFIENINYLKLLKKNYL